MIIIIVASILFVLSLIIVVSRLVNKKTYAIQSVDGIEFYGYIEIGNIEQYVQIRGEHKDNPVIIFVHGGPGFPITYLSTYHQHYLEEDFTIVNYDQRGSGRTYYRNLSDGYTNQTLSSKILLEDLDGIVNYICNKLEQDKIIMMGQSWGSILGTNYVRSTPDKVEAYIGVGQVTDFDQGKVFAAEKAMLEANEEDQKILLDNISIFKETSSIKEIDIENLESLILTSQKYLKSGDEISGMKQMWLGLTSPTMNFQDIKWFLKASSTESIFDLEKNLVEYMYFDFNIFEEEMTYQVPMYFLQGSNDYITPTGLVETFYEQLESPDKKMKLQKGGGHTPFLDDPKTFAELIKSFLN